MLHLPCLFHIHRVMRRYELPQLHVGAAQPLEELAQEACQRRIVDPLPVGQALKRRGDLQIIMTC